VSTAIVIASGSPPLTSQLPSMSGDELIVAVDGGLSATRALGFVPTVVLGDLDSAQREDLDWADSIGVDIVRFPTDKDSTDLALALRWADERAVDHIVVLGAGGRRIDHQFGNWAVVADPDLNASVEVRDAGGTTYVVHSELTISGSVGDTISVIAWGGPARGVRTSGLRWELDDAELSPTSSLGVSNELIAATASIAVAEGILFVIVPTGD